jgi:hypothetical protein
VLQMHQGRLVHEAFLLQQHLHREERDRLGLGVAQGRGQICMN